MNWKDCFQYFIELKTDDYGKTKPKHKVHGEGSVKLSFEEANDLSLFGGILHEGYVDISFDNPEMGKTFLKIRDYLKWNCFVFVNPTNEHIHTIFKDTFHRFQKKSAKDVKLSCGLIADIHFGYTEFRLREPTHERFPPMEETITDISEVPVELLIVKTTKILWNLKNGDGRNSELYGYIPILQKQLHLKNDECKRIIDIINRFVFAEPLPEQEIETITRSESLKKYEIQTLEYVSAYDLIHTDLEPVYFSVIDFLPMGLSILASPPKFGKSYLCLQLGIAVANGSDFLGYKTNKSKVLYLALEDSNNRCKERLNQITNGEDVPKNFHIMIHSPTLGNGLIDSLNEYVRNNPDVKLIIIDTFAKIRDGGKNNEGAYSADYRESGVIKEFADEHKIALLLIHHTRKAKDIDDPFANISGTQGITGAADTMIVLSKEKRSSELTKLSITGRDITQREIAITRDPNRGIWLKNSDDYALETKKLEDSLHEFQYTNGNIRKTLLFVLKDQNSWKGSMKSFIDVSITNGFPIEDTPQKLSKSIDLFRECMKKYDSIMYSVVANGSGGKIHKFSKCS